MRGSVPERERHQLALQMQEFIGRIPASADLQSARDFNFLYGFEAERLLTMRQMLLSFGFHPEQPFKVLDFGYLHGLVPEFLHRFFPKADFVVFDHPNSPIFSDSEYLKLIRERDYLKLEPCDIMAVNGTAGTFDLVVLGEIIEHMDPTAGVSVFQRIRSNLKPDGCLLITTPNGGGLYNLFLTLQDRRGQTPVRPPLPEAQCQFPHIHLWIPGVLMETMETLGWRMCGIAFNHGRETEKFRQVNRSWGSLSHQVVMRCIQLLTWLKPRFRGFFVSTWKAAPQTDKAPTQA